MSASNPAPAGTRYICPMDPDVRARMQAALDATVALRSNARGWFSGRLWRWRMKWKMAKPDF